jgi:hypothetical protein
LIGEWLHRQLIWKCRGNLWKQRLDSGDHLQGGGIAGLLDREKYGPLAIHAHDVGLRRKAIAHPGNVFHVDRGIANCLDRNPVQIRDRLGCGIRNVDVVFLAADFGCSGWQNQVLS